MADIQVDLGHGRNAGGQRQSRCNSLDPPCCRTCSVLTKNAAFTTKSTFSRDGRTMPQAPGLRSLSKYPAPPRESGLGWMARHERRECPSRGGGMRSEQRSRRIQSALALRVASLFRLSGGCSSIADRCAYAHSSRLGKTKNRRQRATAGYFQQPPRLQRKSSDQRSAADTKSQRDH
jgi:hypothetical protein